MRDNEGRTLTANNGEPHASKRADALRNARTVLEAAAAVFVESGVDAPIRQIASRAGVGIATIYRHYPTRQDLIVAVYRHQVEACAAAAPELLASSSSAFAALRSWVGLFVEFLTTKHGLASAMSSDEGEFGTLHAYFLDRLVPACSQILDAGIAAGEFRPGVPAALLLRAVGNLCVTSQFDQANETQNMVDVFLDGMTVVASPSS
ncbi:MULTISPECIES: TetR/AcrR family transcriptional regulator [Amycolatopsis]|nr:MULTISPECIES: TetR/AcrR family transcriptional regulator [Amycolatopsis]OAP28373.1 Bacterial regulatory protein, tetR family [Amycolatopsis sp. M39]SFQ17644.1 DNA-binding transcriptional regulator, AcrR family [Amycolatopsis rubida]